MRHLLPLAVLLLGACRNEPPVENAPVTRIEIGKGAAARVRPGPTVADAASPCSRDTFEGVVLTHCIADPARHRIRMALGKPPYRSFAALAAGLGAEAGTVAFAMNGGMFGDDGQPIGYYVERGERLKTLNRADGGGNFHLKPNGVFFGSGTKWQVLPSDAFYADVADRPRFGTQSGPMLVIAGKLHPEFADEGPSKLVRNGVGVDAAGRAHFVLSEGPVSFGRFARFFRDRLKTPNALYLDGTVSALWDPASARRDESVPLGPFIVVEKMESKPREARK